MNTAYVFLMALAAVGTSADPQTNTAFQSNNLKIIRGGCGSTIPSVRTHIRTSAVENPTINFPTFFPPTTVSQSCHCLRTIVRPQILNEIITVPTVDRILRTVATPIVETVESAPLGTFTEKSILSGVSGSRNSGGVFQNISTLGGNNNGLFAEENARSFSTYHSSNSANGGSLSKSNRASGNVISQPNLSAFQKVNEKNYLGSTSTIFSGNSGYINNGRILGF